MTEYTNAQIETMIRRHLVTIVGALRHGLSVSGIASFLRVPAWLVLRIGHDAHLLSEEQEAQYQAILDERGAA